jgi:hypothetical protein
MGNSQLHPQGWLSLVIAPEYEERAKQMRAERDRQYGNIYKEAATDARWVGDLGEIVFNSWLKHEGIKGFEWIREDTAGQPDFVTTLNMRIEVKSVKRQGPPRKDYTAQITASHANGPIDHYFFMSYDISPRCMWLLGGIDREYFLQESRYYKAGEWVHPNYQVRDHDIYNIEVTKLIPPKEWILRIA